jgi:hypothetical protein
MYLDQQFPQAMAPQQQDGVGDRAWQPFPERENVFSFPQADIVYKSMFWLNEAKAHNTRSYSPLRGAFLRLAAQVNCKDH